MCRLDRGFTTNGIMRAFTVRQAAIKVASNKVAKHEKTCSDKQHVFIPFASDTFGFLAADFVDFLQESKGLCTTMS
jgi:hypothetical protein